MSYLDDLTYRTLTDGYDTVYPVRKTLKFSGSILTDDELNDRTVVSVLTGAFANLQTVCDIGSEAYARISQVYDPVDALDAVNLQTLESSLTLENVLNTSNTTNGKHINLTSGSYIYSSDGYVVVNDTLDVNNHQIINLSAPTLSTDAVTKGYVDTLVGSIGLGDVLAVSNIATNNIDMSGNKITSLAIPTDGYDAANKWYVDTQIASIPAPVLDHGNLTGLADDDHTQYLLVNGTRAMSGDLNIGNNDIINVNTIELNSFEDGYYPSWQEGLIWYDSTNHALVVYNDQSDVTQQLGQELFCRVINKTGSTITNGSVVYISGAQGNRPTISLAKADNLSTTLAIGLVTHDVLNNQEGFVTVKGVVHGVNTSSFTAGDMLYVSPTTAGSLTNVKPLGEDLVWKIGVALNSTVNGSIAVSDQGPTTLTELHDVNGITSAVDGYYLRGNGTSWEGRDFDEDVLQHVNSVINYLNVYYYVSLNKITLTSGVNTTIVSYTFSGLTNSTNYLAQVAFRSNIWQDGYTNISGQVEGSAGVYISVSGGGVVTCTFKSLYPDVSELPVELSSANYTLVPISNGFDLKCQQSSGSTCYDKSNLWIMSLTSLV